MPNANQAQVLNAAQVSIVILMIASSLTVWWMWFRRWKRFGEIWQHEPADAPFWNSAVVVVALAIIGLFLFYGLTSRSGESKPITVEQVRSGCLERVALAAMMLGLLISFGARSVREFGITLANWRTQVMAGLETAHASFLPVLLIMVATALLRQPGEKRAACFAESGSEFGNAGLGGARGGGARAARRGTALSSHLAGMAENKDGLGVRDWNFVAGLCVYSWTAGCAALLPLARLLGNLYDRQQRYLSVVVAHGVFNLWNIALTIAAC